MVKRIPAEASGRDVAGGDVRREEITDVVVASNRQPYRHSYADDDGTAFQTECPTGGLAAGLDPVVQELEGTWIAWGDGDADFDVADEDGCVRVPPDDGQYTLQRLALDEDEIRGYYDGFSNQLLWPLCHSLTDKMNVSTGDWETYRDVNATFSEAICDHVGDGTAVWFQDYHLALAPRMTRACTDADLFLMQFWHIPWPAPDVFRACPWARELIDGLLGNDMLSFHVSRYCANFLECVDRFVPDASIDWSENRVHYADGSTTVTVASMGIDAGAIYEHAEAATGEFWSEFRHEHGIDADTAVVLGVDRLDYTKGIPERLEALEHLWETRPEWRESLTYVQKGSESRTRIPAYQELQQRVVNGIDRINDRFGTDDWQPVVFVTERLPRERLVSLYRHSDVGLVSSLRDGMNLVAQEYVAAQVGDDGVLVLSELTGASRVLGERALTVNPHDVEATADTIVRALTMSRTEREERMFDLRRAVHAGDMESWIDSIFDDARDVRASQGVR